MEINNSTKGIIANNGSVGGRSGRRMFCAQISLCLHFHGTIGIVLSDVNGLGTLRVGS